MKKLLSVFLMFMAFAVAVSGVKTTKTKTLAAPAEGLSAVSESAYLSDFNSGTVIYSKNETERLPIASMCKIMTLLLTFEAIDDEILSLDDTIVVSAEAAGMGGSQIFLDANKPYAVRELVKGVVVASANDASVALAEQISGSEELFVAEMNAKCKELGMNDTHFSNCTGLPKAEQFSCAKDVAKMFSELLKHEEYFSFSRIWMDKIEHDGGRITEISNTNKLIRFYDGCDGGKTGYTSEAGHCLAASAQRKGMRLISVVIKAPASKSRFNDVSTMFNYGFANFENKLIVDSETPLEIPVTVAGGKSDTVRGVPAEPYYLFGKKNEKTVLNIDFAPDENVKAPVEKGEKIGTLTVEKDGVLVKEISVLACETVEKQTYFDIVKNIIDHWKLF